MDSTIEVRGLTKAYGTNEVLRGIDLTVAGGEIFALLGPNGAGKTTTVRVLATLATPDSGTVRVAGADAVAERHLVRSRIALTGQYAALDTLQSGRENLVMMGRLAGLCTTAARHRAGDLLDRFDLVAPADRRVATYSGGMRRRLDLAASLVRPPSVLFLDEPTTGLDPRSRRQLWAVVAEIAAHGTTVFLTTQYLEEADRLAGRIAVIDHGTVVAEGTAAQLKARVAGHRLELVARDAAAFADLQSRAGDIALDLDAATRRIAVPVEDSAADVRGVLDRLDPDASAIERFAIRTASLDDVFLTLTGRRAEPDATDIATEQEPAHV